MPSSDQVERYFGQVVAEASSAMGEGLGHLDERKSVEAGTARCF